jgi:hypothetical protein
MSPALVGLLAFCVLFAGSAVMVDMVVAKRPDVDDKQVRFTRIFLLVGDIVILAVLWLTGAAQTVGEIILGAAG